MPYFPNREVRAPLIDPDAADPYSVIGLFNSYPVHPTDYEHVEAPPPDSNPNLLVLPKLTVDPNNPQVTSRQIALAKAKKALLNSWEKAKGKIGLGIGVLGGAALVALVVDRVRKAKRRKLRNLA